VALQVTPQEALPTVLPALDGGYQRRSGDTLYPAVPLATGPPAASPESSSPLVEPDSVIRALAGGLRLDASEAGLKALEQYLGRAVVLRVGPGSSSAAATLRRGSGNEAERATVAVAMAREAGFPARRAWGLRHEAGAWQLRTWAEVWVDGWTPVEAGGGARPGDRVRLGMGRGVGLADLAIRTGRLRLEFARGRQ
jgi:transglutaminase-like putative cysteine protease